jgi:hypothetical protein
VRVYEQVTLSALYLLAAIVSLLSCHTISLHRLAIHYAAAGLRFSLHAHTQMFMFAQGGVQPLLDRSEAAAAAFSNRYAAQRGIL